MIHQTDSPLKGKTVKIKANAKHPQVKNFGGSEFLVENWWDKVSGGSWMFADGNPACMIYAIRTGFSENTVPIDDEVLYGKIGCFGHLVYISEIEE